MDNPNAAFEDEVDDEISAERAETIRLRPYYDWRVRQTRPVLSGCVKEKLCFYYVDF